MKNCLTCSHWSDKARADAKQQHWCRELNTWTAAGFCCKAHDEMLRQDESIEGNYYTIADVANACHVTGETVRYWIMTGRIKAVPMPDDSVKLAGQFKTQWRIDKPTADRYIEWYLSMTF